MKTLIITIFSLFTLQSFGQTKDISKTLEAIKKVEKNIAKSNAELDSLNNIILNSEIYKMLEPFYIKEYKGEPINRWGSSFHYGVPNIILN